MEADEQVVYLVDDDSNVRDLLVASLSQRGLRTLGFSSAEAFLQGYNPAAPGCLILDLCMPHMDGLQLQEELIRRGHSIPIIFISGSGTIPQTVQALKAGAVDFLEKPFRTELLLHRIEDAFFYDAKLRARKQKQESIKARFARLTERENEVLGLLVSGRANLSNRDIARELDISHRTVDRHRSRIMEKTRTETITELARLFDEAGLKNLTTDQKPSQY